MKQRVNFNRMEFAGSLGDLGTLLPMILAMVWINGMDPVGIFYSVALFYILSGLYFGVTVPVQPMKIIAAYAIATGISMEQIMASSLLMAILLLVIGVSGSIDKIRQYTPPILVCSIQLTTGLLLIFSGFKLIVGESHFQQLYHSAEPFLEVQFLHLAWLGKLPIGMVLAFFAIFLTYFLINNRRFPAALVLLVVGILAGGVLGAGENIQLDSLSFSLPSWLGGGDWPNQVDFSFALLVLVLPQLPMTLGNAVLAYTDLSRQYFQQKSIRVSNKNVCVSMAGANLLSFSMGGIPLCHGAGGLAAHYRFGARTAGSNLIIGFILLLLTFLYGERVVHFFHLIPMSILGILLIFAGVQLCLGIKNYRKIKDYFIIAMVLLSALVSNLAVGFMVGLLLCYLQRRFKN